MKRGVRQFKTSNNKNDIDSYNNQNNKTNDAVLMIITTIIIAIRIKTILILIPILLKSLIQ